MIAWLAPGDPADSFPPVERALRDPQGLLAAGGDLSVERLVAAYRRGIFPWYSPGQPVLWWSPDPREVLLPHEFHVSRSLARALRVRGFEYRVDGDFEAVIDACAAPRAASPGTWITTDMRAAYVELHRRGFAHSCEIRRAGKLVGGVYGVRLGRVFFGESMFSLERDASKAALAGLVRQCLADGTELIDCQLPSEHLRSLGSRALPREKFLARLARAIDAPAGGARGTVTG
ncbi:MAG: leucyl/phenylalanyl-tRNA--protein transferase [Gammaproteobacteria bacterium]|nr:leucyl/phenylalanyl-tRNA--protein transferase [Gammaproteobacteria bacterium]